MLLLVQRRPRYGIHRSWCANCVSDSVQTPPPPCRALRKPRALFAAGLAVYKGSLESLAHMSPSTSLIAILLLCASMASTAPLPLLFVGNSYTYYNDLPSLVRNMLDDGSPPPTSCAADGDAPSLTALRWTIGGHFWRQDLEEVSNSSQALYGYLRPPSKWRYVIYQEQSVTPSLWTCANSQQEAAWSVRLLSASWRHGPTRANRCPLTQLTSLQASSTAILGLNSLSQALEGPPPSILYEVRAATTSTHDHLVLSARRPGVGNIRLIFQMSSTSPTISACRMH